MKVTCITTSRIPSDTANSIQVMKTCQALARLKHTVRLLVPCYRQTQVVAWQELAERYGLSQYFDVEWLDTLPLLRRNDFAFAAVKLAREGQADLVYTWTGQAAVVARLRKLPVVYELHDVPTGHLGPVWLRAFLRLGGQGRLAIITQALRQRLDQQYGKLPDKMVTLAPNGVDMEQYADLPDASTARQQLGWLEMETVLCAGHLYQGRGVDLFLGLAGNFSNMNFVWVGGRAADVKKAQQLAADHGLHNVFFTGFVSNRDLPLYQAAADVLLMPYAQTIAGSGGGNSAQICSPMKMFDYLAAGRAILSSDLPVIREVLDGTNACFAAPEDLSAWTAALTQLMNDPLLRMHLGRKAQLDAQKYSWQLRVARILQSLEGERA